MASREKIDASRLYGCDPEDITTEEDARVDTITQDYMDNLRREVSEQNPSLLRTQFAERLIELANHFDSLDHEYSADGRGSALQHDARSVRQMAEAIIDSTRTK